MTTTHQTKTEPVKQFMFNGAAEEFVPLDRQNEAQKVQKTKDEAEISPSISKEEVSKDVPLKAAKKKGKRCKTRRKRRLQRRHQRKQVRRKRQQNKRSKTMTCLIRRRWIS